jgi:predicted metal-dependent peptidase
MSEFNLNDHMHRLLMREAFFAPLSRQIDKEATTAIPTAGVRINPDTGYFELKYNPTFFEGLTDEQRSGVLIHEFYHLVFEHVTGRLPDELAGVMSGEPTREQAQLFKLWNVAADLSINCLIGRESLPEMCCFPGEGMFESMPPGETAEWYYAELKRMVEEKKKSQEEDGDGESGEGQPGDGSGGFDIDEAGQFDDHGSWTDGASQEMREVAKQRLKEAVKKAAQEASQSNSWGSVSSQVRKDILDRINPRVDWKKVLRYFCKTSQRAERRSTPKRLNSRFPYIHSGRRVKRTASIAVSIDQSGSVDDNMLAAFYSELNKLSGIATFTVIPFDDKVFEGKVYTWKKGETRKWERVLCGGTNFDAPTDYVNAQKFDGHIILTDLMAPKPKASKCQRMWMTTKYYAERPYFKTNERIIAIDV